MKKLIAASILLCSFTCSVAHAQLYGIGPSGGQSEFYSINPGSGTTTPLDSFNFSPGYAAGSFSTNPSLGTAYALSGLNTNVVFTFSLSTGAVLSTSTLATSLDGLAPGNNGQLSGIGPASGGQFEFYSIDPGTGNTTPLNPISFASGGFALTTFISNPAQGTAYALTGLNNNILATFNLSSGALLSTNTLSNSLFAIAPGLNGTVFGIGPTGNQDELYSINPSTGATTPLNSFSFASGGLVSGTFVSNPALGTAYAISGLNDNVVYTFSLSTGAVLSTTTLSNNLEAIAIPEPASFLYGLVAVLIFGLTLRLARRSSN